MKGFFAVLGNSAAERAARVQKINRLQMAREAARTATFVRQPEFLTDIQPGAFHVDFRARDAEVAADFWRIAWITLCAAFVAVQLIAIPYIINNWSRISQAVCATEERI